MDVRETHLSRVDGSAGGPGPGKRAVLTWRTALGALVLAVQLLGVVYVHVNEPRRYYGWGPNDYIVDYRIEVRIDGVPLSRAAVDRRYRIPAVGVNESPVEHVMDVVRQYEETYGRRDEASVLLRYRTNGGATREWRWPDR